MAVSSDADLQERDLDFGGFQGRNVAPGVDPADAVRVDQVSLLAGLSTYACDPVVAVLDAVYISAADTVDKADADDTTKQPVIGFVVSKPDPTTAIVRFSGELSGFAGLTPGKTQYLSTVPGQITETAPSSPPDPPGTIVQPLGFARNATTIVIEIERDFTIL
jgi:hypothetical protein